MDANPASSGSLNAAFWRAVESLGGQVEAAKVMNRTQSAISKRLNRGDAIWPENVLAVEAATGISRHELRPDIYPIEDPQSPQHPAGDMPAAVAEPPAAAGEPLSQSPGGRPVDVPAVSEGAAGACPSREPQA